MASGWPDFPGRGLGDRALRDRQRPGGDAQDAPESAEAIETIRAGRFRTLDVARIRSEDLVSLPSCSSPGLC